MDHTTLDDELRTSGRVLVFTDDTGFGDSRLSVLASVYLHSDEYPAACDDLRAIRDELGVPVLHAREMRAGKPEDMATRLDCYRRWCQVLTKYTAEASFTYLRKDDEEILKRVKGLRADASVPAQRLGHSSMLSSGHHKFILGQALAEQARLGRTGEVVSVEESKNPRQAGTVTRRMLKDMGAEPPEKPPLVHGDCVYIAADRDVPGLELADLAAHSLSAILRLQRQHTDLEDDADLAGKPFDKVVWEEIAQRDFTFCNVHLMLEALEDARTRGNWTFIRRARDDLLVTHVSGAAFSLSDDQTTLVMAQTDSRSVVAVMQRFLGGTRSKASRDLTPYLAAEWATLLDGLVGRYDQPSS